MALTAKTTREFVGLPEEISPIFVGNDTYYKGAIVVYNADGLAAVPSDTANLSVAGIVSGTWADGVVDNAYAIASGTNTIRGTVYRGKTWIAVSGCAQTDVDEIWYVSDDNTMTQTAGSKTVGYRALDFKTGYLLFDFRVPDRIA